MSMNLTRKRLEQMKIDFENGRVHPTNVQRALVLINAALAEPSNSCNICGGCESMTYTVNCIRGSGIELRYNTHRGKEAHYCPNCGKAIKGGEDA